MLNKTLKSIAAVLVCLTMIAGSIPAVAAEINDPALSQGEPAPAQTEPVITEPIVTEPAVTVPAVTEPAVTEPIVTEPAVTEPAVTEPAVTEPAITAPAVTEPAVSEPDVTDPAVTEPSATETLPPEDTAAEDNNDSQPADTTATDSTLSTEETGDPLATDNTPMPTFAVQWDMLPMYSGANGVYKWSIVLENGGYYIYAVTNMYERASFEIMYDEDGREILRYEATVEPAILDSTWNPIPGAYIQSYVDDVTRYAEIFIPQNFFKDFVFTITCGQSVYSLDITDSHGMPALPDILGEASTLEEPAAMSDEEFAKYVSIAASNAGNSNNSVYNWGATYENGNYVIYLVAGQYSYQDSMTINNENFIFALYADGIMRGWGSPTPNSLERRIQYGGNTYAKYIIPESTLPADFSISYAGTTLTSAEIKSSAGNIEMPDDPAEDEPASTGSYPDIEKAITPEIDWNNGLIPVNENNNGSSAKWSIVKEGDYYYIAIMDNSPWNGPSLSIKYADGATDSIGVDIWGSKLTSQWDNPDMANESALQTNVVNNEVRYTEIKVPANTFRSKDFTISLNGTSINSSEITDSNGVIPEPEPELNYPDVDSVISPVINWNSESVAVYECDGGDINKWSVVREGSYYYFLFNGSPNSLPSVNVTYPNGAQMCPGPVTAGASSGSLATGQGYVIVDSSTNSANDRFNSSKYTEMKIPARFFESDDFTLECGGIQISNSDIKDVNGNTPAPYDYLLDNAATAQYNGITIDGNISDWDGVAKFPIDDGNPNGVTVEKTALVWDGDYIYIYLASRNPNLNSICNAGSHGNGQYVITTDLGRMLLIQPTVNESTGEIGIAGIDGAQIAVNKLPDAKKQTPYEWEIAIPTSCLPKYIDTISFGMYMPETDMQTPIHGVTNLQGTDTSNKVFNGIVIDGSYNDWEYYPHSLIQYATAGTGEHVVDANAALFSNGGQYIYGHAETVMPQHYTGDAWEVGKFNLSINDTVFDQNKDFQSRMVYEDPVTHQLTFDPQGIMMNQDYYQPYHYYIIDIGYDVDPSNIVSIEQLRATGKLYGDGYITRTPDSYDIEFEIDVEMLAAKAGMDPNDIKTINAQFIRLGDQWITTAGTSTGAFLGIILCLATVSGTYIFKKKKAMRIN